MSRPEGLGRYEPPEGSVTLESAWRVDPNRASGGYAIALLLAVIVTIAWLVWAGFETGQTSLQTGAGTALTDAQRRWLVAQRGHATAPWVVAFTLLSLMGLGTTKRCFGFDRGTALAFGLVVLFQVATATSGLSDVALDARHLGLGAPFAAAVVVGLALVRSASRHLERARRAIAAFAYFSLAVMVLRAALVAFVLDRGLGGEGGVIVSAGCFLGAATVAAPWLWLRRSGTPA